MADGRFTPLLTPKLPNAPRPALAKLALATKGIKPPGVVDTAPQPFHLLMDDLLAAVCPDSSLTPILAASGLVVSSLLQVVFFKAVEQAAGQERAVLGRQLHDGFRQIFQCGCHNNFPAKG